MYHVSRSLSEIVSTASREGHRPGAAARYHYLTAADHYARADQIDKCLEAGSATIARRKGDQAIDDGRTRAQAAGFTADDLAPIEAAARDGDRALTEELFERLVVAAELDAADERPTTASQTWAITAIAHPALRDVRPDCPDCLALATDAAVTARATGSTSSTAKAETRTENGERVEHSATVHRAVDTFTLD